MDIPKLSYSTPVEMIGHYLKNTMVEHLGIQFTAYGEGWVEATMPVDHRTFRPGNMLHGGANLALAETIAGFGSMLAVDIQEYDVRGIQVSANHTGKPTAVKCMPAFLSNILIRPATLSNFWTPNRVKLLMKNFG